MQLRGEEQFSLPPEGVWERLVDLNFMAQAVPDLVRVEKAEPNHLVCRVRPGFSFLSGSLTLTFDLVAQQPAESATYRVHGKGVGASVLVETVVRLAAQAGGTQLTWTSDILERGGLLKPIGTSLIQAAANKITADVWAEFRRGLDA